MKTLKEIADELGTEKYAVRNLIYALELGDKLTRSGNRYLIDEEQAAIIKKAYAERSGEELNVAAPESDDEPEEAPEPSSEQPTAQNESVSEQATAPIKEPPYGLTIPEWADNRQLRFSVISLESELSKEKLAKNILERDFDQYKTQAEKTLTVTISEYEKSAAAKQAAYVETLTAKQAAYDKALAAKDEQLDKMTAALAKLAPYFGDPLAEEEKIGFFKRIFKRLTVRKEKVKTIIMRG